MITGRDLIELGFEPGPWFKSALNRINSDPHITKAQIIEIALAAIPPKAIPLRDVPIGFNLNIMAEVGNLDEEENVAQVAATMQELLRVPTLVAGTVMPDACPAGTIPVGGVVAAKNAIHPGFHSADICCSVAAANLGRVDPKGVLDRAMEITHFGPGGRKRGWQFRPTPDVLNEFDENPYLSWLPAIAIEHFATQGDGNHFLYVGTLRSTGDTMVVTHHGSRKPGAMLYKKGQRVAEEFRKKLSPETPAGAGWIPLDTPEGEDYWSALRVIEEWTRQSHFKIHALLGFPIHDWFWNPHNFVFQRNDIFYHAKGATPGWSDYDRTLVPLNMAEPILITKGADNPNALGFLPHGAGRNMSRTRFLKQNPHVELPKDIDVRFFCGEPDLSELPQAYKNAAAVREQIGQFELAEITDEIVPYGTIMAGDWQKKFRKRS